MPIYEWKCPACKKVTEVVRRMADYDVSIDKCSCGCNGGFTRHYSAPQVLVYGKSDDQSYPAKLVVGRKVDGGKDVPDEKVFLNRKEHDDWMSANDKIRTADLYDPAIGESQHSKFDQSDPPPSPEAVELANQITFV